MAGDMPFILRSSGEAVPSRAGTLKRTGKAANLQKAIFLPRFVG